MHTSKWGYNYERNGIDLYQGRRFIPVPVAVVVVVFPVPVVGSGFETSSQFENGSGL